MKKSVKIAIVCAITAVIIAASAIVGVSLYHNSPNYQLSLAERYISEMNYEQAIITLEKYLEIEPNDVDAWLMLADSYYKLGDLDKAIDALECGISHIDDERLHNKLDEYLREKNPPVTTAAATTSTTTTTTAAETEPPINEEYIDYVIIEPNVESIYSRDNGLFVTDKDDLYAFTDLYGNLKSGYDFMKVFYSYGNETNQYCVAQRSENQYLLVNGNYDTVIDLGKPDNWYFFNKEEPLIAVTYSGKSYWIKNQSTGEFDEYDDTPNSYLQIYRCRDGELLYNWSNGDWIDGKGTQGSLNDSRMSFQYPDKTVKINDIYYTFYGFDVSIYGRGIGTEDDCLSWVFNVDPQYYVSDWTEQFLKWATDDYDKRLTAQNGGGFWIESHNYSGFSNYVNLPVKALYKDGKISIVVGEGKAVREEDNYSIHDIHLMPTMRSEYKLIVDGKSSYATIDNEGYFDSRFGWVTKIFKDIAICGRTSSVNADNVDIAFYKPVWYSAKEKADEKYTTEWVAVSDWIENVKYISTLEENLFCLTRISPDDEDKTQDALFEVDETGNVNAITDWFDSIYWNNEDDNLLGAKLNGSYCFIDRHGKSYGEYEDVTSFLDGVAIVKENGKAYFINEDFEKISEEFESDSSWAIVNNIFGARYDDNTKFVVVGDYRTFDETADTTTVIVTTPAITAPDIQTNVPYNYDEYFQSYSRSRDAENEQPEEIKPVSTMTYNGRKYAIYDVGYDWHDAKDYCESIGGHLVTITSKKEQKAINTLLERGEKNSYWMGGEQVSDNNFRWITGESFDYTNWALYQPDADYEDKLMIYKNRNPYYDETDPDDYGGKWNDLMGDGTCFDEEFFGLENFGFICEWE